MNAQRTTSRFMLLPQASEGSTVKTPVRRRYSLARLSVPVPPGQRRPRPRPPRPAS